MKEYNVIIMVTPEKLSLLKVSYSYLQENLGAKQIYLVANSSLKHDIESMWNGKMHFLDEESIMPGLSVKTIKELLVKKCGDGHRAGWFYQQFLKMAYAMICEEEYYLLWDADTVPLHAMEYFNDETPYFITKREYYAGYFDTIGRLFQDRVGRLDAKVSYIAENMMIHKGYMQEMIAEIMKNQTLEGETFYQKILDAINPKLVSYTGFSEFETYGNYMDTIHPGVYKHKKIRTQRLGSFLLGTEPNREQLEWVARDYDIISFEEHGKQWLKKITQISCVRRCFHAKTMFDVFIELSNLNDRLCGRPYAKID